jgi:hypothetical protein
MNQKICGRIYLSGILDVPCRNKRNDEKYHEQERKYMA